MFTLGAPLGTLIGLSVGAWIAYYHGWRAAFVWMAAPGFVAAVLVLFFAFEPARGGSEGAPADDGATHEPLRTVLRDAWRSSAFVKI